VALSIGIVGLPNVGKSTLFTALTKKGGLAANYPFATIEPNVGVVPVPDARLRQLANIVHPGRIVPATVEFVDIAGLVEGANAGEGLGNQFLSNIRETDAIVELVRYFSDDNVVHLSGGADPARDADIIKTELILADLGTLERSIPRLQKEAKRNKEYSSKLALVEELYQWLNAGKRAAAFPLADDDRGLYCDLHLLTAKPLLYVANVDEDRLSEEPEPIDGIQPIPICAKLESELAEMAADEAAEYLEALGIAKSGLQRLVGAAYRLLGLQSFFTAGETEVRAWTVPVGAKAPQAAGVIHTDFERGFIKAETAAFADYIAYEGEAGLRAAGKLRIEGKDYVVQDGDVMHFRFNV
jgi:GTP-binding protein YchF